MTDITSIINILNEIKNRIDSDVLEIYNLAAQSHVGVSFKLPMYTAQCDAVGTLNILEAIRTLGMIKQVKFYNAATSELFGNVLQSPQNETTPFNPVSPYAIAKQYAFYMTKNYREAYGLFACNGILFNHESKRRGFNFITKKICMELGKIVRGEKQYMEVGNLNALRDWGHSKDYVRAMWMILQQHYPEDFVVGTGRNYSVRQFIEISMKMVDIDIFWEGEGVNELGLCAKTGKVLVKINPKYFRPCEVETLLCDPTKITREVGWKPEISFRDMICEMVNDELDR
jgi:GDPmannose 4,6-dehydratase